MRLSSYTLDAKTNVRMKSSVHLGFQYQENLVACRNTNFEELKSLFDTTLRLIVEQSFEILNASTMICIFSHWMRSTLCHDQDVCSDSVLCLAKMHDHSVANEQWQSQIREFQQSNEYTKLSGVDGEPIEFEWNISQDSHRLKFSERSRKIWKLDK